MNQKEILKANNPKRQYRTITADHDGYPVRSMKSIGKYSGARIVLFSNGIPVGAGSLYKKSGIYLHTDSVRLRAGFRRKGHGVPLYLAFIRRARKLGATRLYSSESLNKYSRRMWSVKLAKLFIVHVINGCKNPCRHCKRRRVFYINL